MTYVIGIDPGSGDEYAGETVFRWTGEKWDIVSVRQWRVER